jgi:hypothetical protein
LAIVIVVFAARTGAWDLEWVNTVGTPSTEGVSSVTADANGVYASGYVVGALPGQTGAGLGDIFVQRYGAAGNLLWTRQFGSSRFDLGDGIAVDATGIYVLGETNGSLPGFTNAGVYDLLVRKYGSDGSTLWTLQFGTDGDEIGYGIVAHDGALYIAASTTGAFPGQAPGAGYDIVIASIDSALGTLTWARQLGERSDTPSFSGGIDVDGTGIYFVGNRFYGTRLNGVFRKHDFAGNPVWGSDIEGERDCGTFLWDVSANGGSVYILGQGTESFVDDPTSGCQGRSQVVGALQKFDANGAFVWQRKIEAGPKTSNGLDHFTGAKTIHATETGVYVGANASVPFPGYLERSPNTDVRDCEGLGSNGSVDKLDAYVRRYDLDGNVLWTHQFGSDVFDLVDSVFAQGDAFFASGDGSCGITDAVPYAGGQRDGFLMRFAIDAATPPGHIQLIVGQLETLWDAGGMDPGVFNDLVKRLEAALAHLDRNEAAGAGRSLEGFVEAVDEYEVHGVLTAAAAASLRDAAIAVMSEI